MTITYEVLPRSRGAATWQAGIRRSWHLSQEATTVWLFEMEQDPENGKDK